MPGRETGAGFGQYAAARPLSIAGTRSATNLCKTIATSDMAKSTPSNSVARTTSHACGGY